MGRSLLDRLELPDYSGTQGGARAIGGFLAHRRYRMVPWYFCGVEGRGMPLEPMVD
jgi:hypothetical protein